MYGFSLVKNSLKMAEIGECKKWKFVLLREREREREREWWNRVLEVNNWRLIDRK